MTGLLAAALLSAAVVSGCGDDSAGPLELRGDGMVVDPVDTGVWFRTSGCLAEGSDPTDVVLTTQNMEHVPFDLRSIRALTYYPNREGLAALKDGLRARLETLINASSCLRGPPGRRSGAAPRRSGLGGTNGQRWPRDASLRLPSRGPAVSSPENSDLGEAVLPASFSENARRGKFLAARNRARVPSRNPRSGCR